MCLHSLGRFLLGLLNHFSCLILLFLYFLSSLFLMFQSSLFSICFGKCCLFLGFVDFSMGDCDGFSGLILCFLYFRLSICLNLFHCILSFLLSLRHSRYRSLSLSNLLGHSSINFYFTNGSFISFNFILFGNRNWSCNIIIAIIIRISCLSCSLGNMSFHNLSFNFRISLNLGSFGSSLGRSVG